MARRVERLMLDWRGVQLEWVGAVLGLQQDSCFAFDANAGRGCSRA